MERNKVPAVVSQSGGGGIWNAVVADKILEPDIDGILFNSVARMVHHALEYVGRFGTTGGAAIRVPVGTALVNAPTMSARSFRQF